MRFRERWFGGHAPLLAACMMAMLSGCPGGGDGESEDVSSAEDAAAEIAVARTYAGFSTEGGTWAFQLDSEKMSLTFRKGIDAPMTRHFDMEDKAPLRFFLRAKDLGEEFFGWEKPMRFLLHAFPLGTGKPSVFAAIGETAPADPALVAGTYLWVEMAAEGESGAPSFPGWGILALRSEGTWSRWDVSKETPGEGAGPVLPDNYSGGWPPSAPPDSGGTWAQVQGGGQITLSGGKSPLTGRVWTEEDTALLLLETEGGMIAGTRAPETAYGNADVVKSAPGETDGMHAIIGAWKGGVRWVGRGVLPGSQERGFLFYRIPGVVEVQDYLVSQVRCGALPSAFSVKFENGAFMDPPGNWTGYVFAAGSLASVWMIGDPEEGILGAAVGLRQDTADIEGYLCDGQLCR